MPRQIVRLWLYALHRRVFVRGDFVDPILCFATHRSESTTLGLNICSPHIDTLSRSLALLPRYHLVALSPFVYLSYSEPLDHL